METSETKETSETVKTSETVETSETVGQVRQWRLVKQWSQRRVSPMTDNTITCIIKWIVKVLVDHCS